jgi:hypothetical protein
LKILARGAEYLLTESDFSPFQAEPTQGDESDSGRFEHDGVNIGFRAELIMWDSGHGVVVMWNDWSFASELAVRYLINNIAKEYGWSYRVAPYTPSLYADTELLMIARLRGTQGAIA